MPWRALLLALVLALAWGCERAAAPAGYRGTDITGADFGRRLEGLRDHDGRPRRLEDFRGKAVVLFFGYTHCPDVCPTTLSDLAQALKLMPPELAARVQVLFVTVDPERDTPELLKGFVTYFHPSFLGLHGSPEAVAQAAREFKVSYRRHVEPGASDYLIDHTAGSFVIDPAGRLRLYLPYAHPPQDIAHDLTTLLRAGG
ncbi:MAG: SCO family protein [Thiobacillaceae bacterium]|nr:SCO family protein [Thiobacillaceae bacterium]MCX7672953.1 SCO family protein [Thiobacillaceae bacterium]MDW8324353.1 SCO family protein [Burkholderiales bacterium]